MATKNPQNDAVLAIRINQELLDQLNALARTKSIGASSLVRMLLSDYIRNEAPKILLGVTSRPQKGKVLTSYDRGLEAMSPAQRKAYDEKFEEDWG